MKNYLINFLIRISSSRAFRIISIYFIVSALWIFFSDTLVYNFPISEELRIKISIIKGWGFVLVTSWLLFSLIRSALKEASNLNIQIHEAEKKNKLISDNTTDVIWAYNLESERLTYASPSIEKLLGYTPNEILKLTVKDFLTEKSFELVSSSLPERIKEFENDMDSAKSQIFEAHLRHKNGSIVSTEIVTTLIKDNSGKVIELVGVSRDITDRKRMEQEREITLDFLRIINESSSLKMLIQSTVIFFKKQSGCEAVGIRLQDGLDYPYYETLGFPPEFTLLENSLCSQNQAGITLRDNNGNPIWECMCGNILSNRFDPSKNYFTQNGSYWTNSTTTLLKSIIDDNKQTIIRNRCNSAGYESVALIPIRYRGKIFGLVQLNDKRINAYTIDLILMLERLAGYLAIAISKFQTEADLNKSEERFKYLFENMVEGFAYCMMLYDQGKPVDFIYINVNDKFEQLTGLKNAIGKKVTHLIPGIKESNPELFEIYGRVASTGIPERFEDYITSLDMWFSVSVYSPKKEFFVAVFDVVTERKRAEEEILKSRTQYRELAAHLQTIREEERTAIAREMHDELGQILSSIKMNLVLIHRQVEDRENTNYIKILSEIDSLNKIIDNAVARVRKLITQLRPELLDKLGLIPALEWYIQEYNKEVKIKCELFSECEECNLDNPKELAIFRIIQESLTNAAKYSEATLILVKLYRDKSHVNIEITDNGKGIDNTKPVEGKTFGLLGMHERANLIGGKLFIESEPGHGTTIKLVI